MSSDRLISSLGLSGELSLTFHQSQSVPDHEDTELQYIFLNVPHSGSCSFFKESSSTSGEVETYLLPLKSMDAFAICANFLAPLTSRSGFKIEIQADGVNVASPTSDFGQDYFVSGQGNKVVWIDGVAVRKKAQKQPRLVRQFVALAPGTGHAYRAQLSTPDNPPSITINLFAGLQQTMEIYVKILIGPTITLSVYRHTSVEELLKQIKSKMMNIGIFEVFFEGRKLNNDFFNTLYDYGIGPHATLFIKFPTARTRGRHMMEMRRLKSLPPQKLVIKKGDLEVGPGGLIQQGLKEDKGEYKWEKRPMKQLVVRIVSPDVYRSLTGSEPEPPHYPPLEKVIEFESWIRSTGNGSLGIMSIAEHQQRSPAVCAFRQVDEILASSNSGGGTEDERDKSRRGCFLTRFCCYWCRK
ncbi:hypothetical protein QBC38DRAFT_484837 [Podospora fimiseda]|uniref:Ubiquitin-like domain-containing protein n=1 Tax=Podospora fimiseda TaxID=252190 RepID=A0AAN7BJW5_9PEZI|nr:hypothetical protein QBC38DRAFT_484837 [Podospora fimiseda]